MVKFRTVGCAHKLACTQQYTIDIVVAIPEAHTVVDIALEMFEVHIVVEILEVFEVHTVVEIPVVAIPGVHTVVEVVVWFDVVGGTLVAGGCNACCELA